MLIKHPFSTRFGEMVALAEGAVLNAAQYLVEEMRSGRKPQVWVKPDRTLVMNLDLECQRRVLESLGTHYPIVAEEDEVSHTLINTEKTYFLVDPLDGTTSCRRFMGELGGQVGYGPLVGFVQDSILSVACFYNVPHQRLYTAVLGEGTFATKVDFTASDDGRSVGEGRTRLRVVPCESLQHAGVLFYLGTLGESRVMQLLKDENAIENMYRFGGFASDCARLANGTEQASVQFAVKPWDFSGILLGIEAGVEMWLDPLKRRIPFNEWRIEMNNPLIAVQPNIREELFAILSRLS